MASVLVHVKKHKLIGLFKLLFSQLIVIPCGNILFQA